MKNKVVIARNGCDVRNSKKTEIEKNKITLWDKKRC